MEDQQFNEFVDQVLSEYLRQNPNASLTDVLQCFREAEAAENERFLTEEDDRKRLMQSIYDALGE